MDTQDRTATGGGVGGYVDIYLLPVPEKMRYGGFQTLVKT